MKDFTNKNGVHVNSTSFGVMIRYAMTGSHHLDKYLKDETEVKRLTGKTVNDLTVFDLVGI